VSGKEYKRVGRGSRGEGNEEKGKKEETATTTTRSRSRSIRGEGMVSTHVISVTGTPMRGEKHEPTTKSRPES